MFNETTLLRKRTEDDGKYIKEYPMVKSCNRNRDMTGRGGEKRVKERVS